MCRKTRKTTPCSSVEVLLSTVTLVLFVVCVGLAVVSWLALQTGNEAQAGSSNSSFSGTLTISEGASFTEELRNRSSVQFKALAFDTEFLVTEAYALSSLAAQLRSCRVTDFSPGSVIAHFTVLFGDVVEVTVVQEQLISGLQNIPDATLVINSSSVHVTDISTTQTPPTTTPTTTSTPTPTTTPKPVPADCGGPFDLYESNSTFSSPNYPLSYGHGASCLWILHANPGQNIQLHFQDFSLEAVYDVVEVRDGVEPNSTLLSVLTGSERKFPDLYSTSSEMMVMFFSDASTTDRGFLANFSTGFNLGQPEPCKAGEYRCTSGVCLSDSSVCDGVSDCPDASDEAQCVHLTPADSPRLKVEIQSRLYTACSSNWSSHFSLYFCRYLGYRSGNASFVSVVAEDAPFAVMTQAANGTVDVKPSETCPSDKAVSLHCNNQSCGKRKVVINTESGSSVVRESRVETEEGTSEGVDGRIVGGEDAVKGAWPWIASLRFKGKQICGATIIDSQWLVTDAYCVYGKNIHLSNWNVVLGLHAQYESNTADRQYHNVDQIVMNPNYNKKTRDSDISLMHLQDKITFTDYIQPICLPDPNQHFEAERKCFIVGWGTLTEGGVSADVLQQAVVPLVNNSLCQERLPMYKITEQMVCAGYPEGGIDSCEGDSGGPLMCEEEDASWVLVGVTSFGRGCARPGLPGVYVLVPKFIDWILETRRLYTHWNGTR